MEFVFETSRWLNQATKHQTLSNLQIRSNFCGYHISLPNDFSSSAIWHSKHIGGQGSSVGIATELRARRSGDRIPVGARFSAPVQTGPGAQPTSLYNVYQVFPGGKERPGRDTHH